jgi:hypothetical protein
MCLRDFKESPTSKRVINNLPPMDIIKEYGQGEDEDFNKCSNDDNHEEYYDLERDGAFSEKRVSNWLNETKEVEEDASNPRKAAKMSKLRRKKDDEGAEADKSDRFEHILERVKELN